MSQCLIDMKKYILFSVLLFIGVLTTQAYPKLVATNDDAATEFPRQKHLVELFTSQGCLYCPLGEEVLELVSQKPELSEKIAWASLHINVTVSDIFCTSKTSTICTDLGATSFPSATFNRKDYTGNGKLPIVVSAVSENIPIVAQELSQMLMSDTTPCLANIKLDATYDETTRMLKVDVLGQTASNFIATYGNNVGLTVYLTEDSLVARQLSPEGTWISDYVHNHVVREVLSSIKGDMVTITNGIYQKSFTKTLKETWNVNNIHVIAFLHRKGSTPITREVINCEMIDLRDLLAVKGDINGDGKVDIADVNAIINMMLGKVEAVPAADLNTDGNVDIADVNAVINLMLGK